MLKLELQQKVIQVKYSGYQAIPSTIVPVASDLHQALKASASNYFGFMSQPSVPSPSEISVSSTPRYHLFWVFRDQ